MVDVVISDLIAIQVPLGIRGEIILADGQYGLELRSGANSAGCCLTRNATWYVNQINIIATP